MSAPTLPRPRLRLKGAPEAKSSRANGVLTVQREIVKEDGETLPGSDSSRTKVLRTNRDDETAYVGAGLGLTLPGPAKSYLSARVDAFCYLPSAPDAASLHAAKLRAKEFVNEAIKEDVEEAQKFFADWVSG